MKNPVFGVPDAWPALDALGKAAKAGPVPLTTLHLVYLRASQLNGCAMCVEMHVREATEHGESAARLHMVAAWREARCFTPAERAALAMTEAVSIIDPRDPVPDALWAEAANHYPEPAMAQLLVNIAMINFWNRTNIPVRTMAG
jgi:AhpD family alkylhydroperoxidase